jgi:hypothetical protein
VDLATWVREHVDYELQPWQEDVLEGIDRGERVMLTLRESDRAFRRLTEVAWVIRAAMEEPVTIVASTRIGASTLMRNVESILDALPVSAEFRSAIRARITVQPR